MIARFFCLLAAVCGCLIGAYQVSGLESLPVVGFNDALRISSNDIVSLARKAEGGDRSAAERLALHYGFYADDMQKYRYYLELAAKKQSWMAISSLVTIYSTHPALYDFDRALVFRSRLKRLSQQTGTPVKADAEWAYEIYLENFVARGNKQRGLVFLEYAARHGSEQARAELIEIYSTDPDIRDPDKARYWEQRSAAAKRIPVRTLAVVGNSSEALSAGDTTITQLLSHSPGPLQRRIADVPTCIRRGLRDWYPKPLVLIEQGQDFPKLRDIRRAGDGQFRLLFFSELKDDQSVLCFEDHTSLGLTRRAVIFRRDGGKCSVVMDFAFDLPLSSLEQLRVAINTQRNRPRK